MGLLEQRTKLFDRLEEVTKGERLHPLIVRKKIPEKLFRSLRIAVALYASRSIPGLRAEIDEEALLEQLWENRRFLHNATPNGLLTPKRHITLEWNAVVKAYVDIIEEAGSLARFVHGWNPPQVRYKDGLDKFDKKSASRPYALSGKGREEVRAEFD